MSIKYQFSYLELYRNFVGIFAPTSAPKLVLINVFVFLQKLFTHKKLNRLPDWVGHGSAGAVATLFHDAIMTPAEGKFDFFSFELFFFP